MKTKKTNWKFNNESTATQITATVLLLASVVWIGSSVDEPCKSNQGSFDNSVQSCYN